MKEVEKSSQKQKQKYYKLRYGTATPDRTQPINEVTEAPQTQEDEDDEIKERWVKNISSRVLSNEERNLLGKRGGLQYHQK